MKMTLVALLAAATLTGCMATTQCVQPDPVQPASKCWNNGVNCGEDIVPFNK